MQLDHGFYRYLFECHNNPIAFFKVLYSDDKKYLTDCILVDCNKQFSQYFSCNAQKCLKKSFKDILNIEQMYCLQSIERVLGNKKPLIIENKSLLENKTFKISIFPSSKDMVILFFEDITESKSSEKALIELQSRQIAILDNIPDIAWLKDVNNKYIAVNKPFCSLKNMAQEEIIGKTDYDIWPSKMAEKFIADDQCVMEQKTRINIEGSISTNDGTILTIEIVKTPIYDADKKVIGTAGIARNITERKETENNLRAVKYQLKAILDNIPDIAWLKDEQSRFLAVNDALVKACKVDIEKIIGKSDFDLFPEELAERYRKDDLEVIKSAKKKIIEEPFESQDGLKKVIETFKTPIFNESGKVIGTAGIAHDITERKNIENKLRENEMRFRELFENINSKVIILASSENASSFIIKDMNRNSELLMKRDKEEMIGYDFFEIVPPAKNTPIYKALQEIYETGKPTYINPFYYEGVNFTGWLSGHIYKLPSGEISMVYDDVTELKEAESSLRLTQFTIDQSSLPIWWVASNGNIYRVNKAVCDTLGYSQEELYIKKIWDINDNYTPDLWEKIFQDLKQKKTIRYESSHRTKDGKSFPVEITANYIEFEGREYNIAYVLDITKRKKTEKELAQKRSDLEEMVDQKTREIQKSLTELENLNLILQEANNHKNKFLSSMSHELRTPLNAVLGFSNALNMEYFGLLNEKQKEYVDLISHSGNHLLSLIDDILDISKIDSGVIDLNYEIVTPEELIEEVISLMSLHFREKYIDLEYKKNVNIEKIYVDPRKFKQILLNLLSNALKFTNEKGSVVIQHQNYNDDFIKVSVKDTGIGIKKKDQKKVFEEFFQTDFVRIKAIGGAGIGLALTKRLVKMHKGEMGLNSEPEVGSEFWFTMPKAKPE